MDRLWASPIGDVNWLNAADATSQGLAYTDEAGHAIMKVDNTTNVANGDKRNSVRKPGTGQSERLLTLRIRSA